MIPGSAPSRPACLRAVRASAWYDLVVTAGFATPWTYTLLHGALSSLSGAFGLGTGLSVRLAPLAAICGVSAGERWA